MATAQEATNQFNARLKNYNALRLLRLRRELWKRSCREDLTNWCIEALAKEEQTPAHHHLLLIRELEAVARGENDRLMIFMPPGSAKSKYTSELFPAWILSYCPGVSIIAASHTATLSERFARRTRNRVADYADVLGIDVSETNRAAAQWETTNEGEYFSTSVGGSVTGRRADLILIDDPVKSRAEAESETVRAATSEWYHADLYTRLRPGGAIVLIMTRWHEEDLGGMLLNEMSAGGDQWRILKLPALADSPDDPLGRKPNEPLWPEWEDYDAILRRRMILGEREFGALYQQNPRPAGTSFFDEQNVLRDGLPVQPPVRCDSVFAVIDSAVKTGSKHDGTAVTFYARCLTGGTPLYILDWDIIQIEGSLLEVWLPVIFQRLEELVVQVKARMGSLGALIEDKASGTILLQQARRHNWPATPIDSALTAVGKDERAISVSGYVNQGMVKMTEHAYNKMTVYKGRNGNHFLMQVFRFQLGVGNQADDLLDTFTYGVAIALGDNKGY